MKELALEKIKNADELIAACERDGERVYVTVNGRARMVCMSMDVFSALRADAFGASLKPDAADRELMKRVMSEAFERGTTSTSMVQRKFCVGYSRAARIIDMLTEKGYISEPNGSFARTVLVDKEKFVRDMKE